MDLLLFAVGLIRFELSTGKAWATCIRVGRLYRCTSQYIDSATESHNPSSIKGARNLKTRAIYLANKLSLSLPPYPVPTSPTSNPVTHSPNPRAGSARVRGFLLNPEDLLECCGVVEQQPHLHRLGFISVDRERASFSSAKHI